MDTLVCKANCGHELVSIFVYLIKYKMVAGLAVHFHLPTVRAGLQGRADGEGKEESPCPENRHGLKI